MQVLSAKELLYMAIVLFLVSFGSYQYGKWSKRCTKTDISSILAKNQEVKKQLIDTKIELSNIKNEFSETLGINKDLSNQNRSLIDRFSEPVIRWKNKVVYVNADKCDGTIGTDKANQFNSVVDRIREHKR